MLNKIFKLILIGLNTLQKLSEARNQGLNEGGIFPSVTLSFRDTLLVFFKQAENIEIFRIFIKISFIYTENRLNYSTFFMGYRNIMYFF